MPSRVANHEGNNPAAMPPADIAADDAAEEDNPMMDDAMDAAGGATGDDMDSDGAQDDDSAADDMPADDVEPPIEASETCIAACERLMANECATGLTMADCVPTCEPLIPDCADLWGPHLECLASSATYTCDDTEIYIESCDETLQAYSACIACAPASEDTPCTSCIKTSCCEELEEYSSSADILGFNACVAECADATCVNDCIAEYPESGAAYDVLLACAEISCPDECAQ